MEEKETKNEGHQFIETQVFTFEDPNHTDTSTTIL